MKLNKDRIGYDMNLIVGKKLVTLNKLNLPEGRLELPWAEAH